MKIDRKKLIEQIEDILFKNTIDNPLEIDETAQKIFKLVWPLIEYSQDEKL